MIAEKSFLALYPDRKLGEFEFSLDYSGHFSDFNANVKRRGNHISFYLSRKWEGISDDVKIGIIQMLFNRLFRTKIRTPSIELYEIFLRKLHIAVPKNNIDPMLKESFDRVNEKYLNGLL